MRDARQVVRRALITEKGARLRERNNVYFFEVDPDANKVEIRRAVEEIFSVRVTKVRTINYAGKPKRLGRFVGNRSSWKKAIVTVAEGQTIELFEQV
jgi:large subunit ribosomal protein L23